MIALVEGGTFELGMSHQEAVEFADSVLRMSQRAATIRNGQSAPRRVYPLHIEEGILDRPPPANCGELVAKVGHRYAGQGVREVGAWTRKEVGILLEIAKKREPFLYPMLLAALCTGMRRRELLALCWEHVQLDAIRVRDAIVRGVTKSPKSDKARTVPISPEVWTLLGESPEYSGRFTARCEPQSRRPRNEARREAPDHERTTTRTRRSRGRGPRLAFRQCLRWFEW